ncbi:hypothetical protein ACLOJK_002028 [Asimina triloba]
MTAFGGSHLPAQMLFVHFGELSANASRGSSKRKQFMFFSRASKTPTSMQCAGKLNTAAPPSGSIRFVKEEFAKPPLVDQKPLIKKPAAIEIKALVDQTPLIKKTAIEYMAVDDHVDERAANYISLVQERFRNERGLIHA